MIRTVIQLLLGEDGHRFVKVAQTTRGVVSPAMCPLDLDAAKAPLSTFYTPAATAQVVEATGIALFRALSSNPNVRQVLESLLMINPLEIEPLYISLDSSDGDEFPWESLCHAKAPPAKCLAAAPDPECLAGGPRPECLVKPLHPECFAQAPQLEFLALDRRWPIGRIVGTTSNTAIERPFTPPLRILAILAATQTSARSEWKSLYNAIQGAGLEIKVLVLLCEKDLEDEIKAMGDARIATQYVIDTIRFRKTISGFRPNFLHFFCHGVGGRAPKLQLATRPDFDSRAPNGSVEIEPKDLIWAIGLKDALWLVTLNCCQGADALVPGAGPADGAAPAVAAAGPPEGIHSFARSLVEQGSFPAVVGMRERIAVNAANTFSQSFYLGVFGELGTAKQLNGSVTSFEWVRMLTQPRNDLLPADAKHWTFPVLYVRPEEFRIEPAANTEVQVELKTLRDFRDKVGGELRPDTLEELNEQIRQLEAKLAT
jgi:CHAT domain